MVNCPKFGIGIKVAKNGLVLMFADDYVIFYKSNKITARHVKATLENNCDVLGQLINF